MPDLVNMARDAKNDDEKMDCCVDDNKYPWGLRIHLNEEEIKKLGLPEMPDVGEGHVIFAKVTIDSVSQRDTKDGTDRSMELQITDLALHSNEKLSDEELGNKLYDNSGE